MTSMEERAHIIIDETQKIIFTKVYPTSQLPDFEEIVTLLAANRQL